MNLDTLLHDALRERARLDRVIAALQSTSNEAGLSANTMEIRSVESGDYDGLPAMQALEIYFKERRGLKIPLSRAVADLVKGGADHGEARRGNGDPAKLISHTIRIGLGNKTAIFDWEPKGVSAKGKPIVSKGTPNDHVMVWLAPTANDPRRRNRR